MHVQSAAVQQVAAVAGRAVELTIRAERAFTFSFEGRDDAAARKITGFFAGHADARAEYDEECDLTCVFVDA